ncbi:MAG: citrate lyase acyl carrier protein, partial [Anaerolineales bacterium]|nr:citrate lyase acyl carrier protein [Anaerolineales bacterium]
MGKIGTAGNQGPGIRSDCFVALELKSSGGIEIILNSKVDALYKKSIQDLTHQILDFFQIKNAKLEIIDRGALPFVLAARIEAA